MATGNNTFESPLHTVNKREELSDQQLQEAQLVFNLRHDGLSALLLTEGKKKLKFSYNKDWTPRLKTDDLLRKLEVELSEIPLEIGKVRHIHWVFGTQKFALIPLDLYQKGQGRKLLAHTCKLEKGEHLYTDLWPKHKIALVYALPNALLDFVKTRFHGSTFSHSSTSLHKLYTYYPKSETFALLHVDEYSAELILGREGNILFYNSFNFEVEEDLLYLVLFALEQLQIIAPEIELKLSGKVLKGEKLYMLLENYMGSLKLIPIPDHFQLSSELGPQEVRRIFKLLGSL